MLPLYKQFSQSSLQKKFSADFHLKTGVRELFLTLFNWSSEKSEIFSSLWLIRCATSIQTVFTVIIGKNFSADFHLNTGVRGLFLTLFLIFWKEWSFLILMTNKYCYLYTNSFQSSLQKKFSADFHLKTGVRELFLTFLIGLLKRVKFFILMTYKVCYLYTNRFHSHHWKKV